MVNLIYQFWIKLESGNVGYQIRNPPASKVGTKNNTFTVISFSTSSSQTSQKWFIREVAIVTISICQFVLPTKQRTIKFLKFCRPVSCLLQTNNFRISKFTQYCSFQRSWWIFHNFSPCQKKKKKNPRKGLLQGHQNAKLHKHKPSLMLIVSYTVTYFFSIISAAHAKFDIWPRAACL